MATSANDRASTTSTCRRSTGTTSLSSTHRVAVSSLVFATGFEVGTDYSRRTGFEIIGRKGLTLTEEWRDGVRTAHGLSVRGFPNCFILSIAQSGFTVNLPYLLDVQATHAAWVITWALRSGTETLEAS